MILKRFKPYRAETSKRIMEDAKDAEVLIVTPTKYGDWYRPFDLHVFRDEDSQQLENDVALLLEKYDGDWYRVTFPWVVAHVDFISYVFQVTD